MAGGAGVGEVTADGEELISLGHIASGGDGDLDGVEVEVEAAAGGFFEARAGPPGGGVNFVWAFVFREADIAVDAHHRFLRGAEVVGSKGEHGLVDFADDGEHGGFQLALVDLAALFEPGAVVVAFEAAKEAEGGGGEVRWHGVILGRGWVWGIGAKWRGTGNGSTRFWPK